MATTFVEYTGDGNATKSFSFPSYQESDVKVRVDGVLKTTSTHYNITGYTTTGGGNVVFTSGNIPSSPANIRIYRDTNVDTAKATFTAGSSVKAADLNNNTTQLLYRAQEEQIPNLIHSYDIDDGAITTAKFGADSVTGAKIADDSINSEHYVDGSIDTAHIADAQITTAKLAADSVTNAKIADDSIDSEHYVDGSIDTAHIGNSQVTTAKLNDNAVTTQKIAADAIGANQIADDSINSEHYVDGSIDTAHIADANVTSAKLATGAVINAKLDNNSVSTTKIQDANVTSAKLATGSVTTAKLDNLAVTTAKIANANITADKIASNAVTTDKIQDGELTTLAGMQSTTASNLASSTALTATTAELNQLDGVTLETSVTTTSNQHIPTSKAVNDQILAVTNALGGFVAIADETSFPTANPDPSNGAGTVVSISQVSSGSAVSINSSGVATIANGAGTGNTVTITGFPTTLRNTSLAASSGLQVQTTTTLHTYTFHKQLASAADIAAISATVNSFSNRYRVSSSAPTSSLDGGDLWYDTTNSKLMVYSSQNSAWEEATAIGNFFISTISSSSSTGGGSATPNGTAYRFTISNAPPDAQQCLVSVDGVIQKPNSGSSQPSEGFVLVGNDIIFGAAPANGASLFVTVLGSTVGIGTPSNNTVTTAILQNGSVTTAKIVDANVTTAKITDANVTTAKIADSAVTSAKIADGAIVNADVNASAAIDVSKLSGVLPLTAGSSKSLTGDLHFNKNNPLIALTDSNSNPDYYIGNIGGVLKVRDTTNAADRFVINTDGHVDVLGNLDVGAGLDVTGVIETTVAGADNMMKITTTSSGDPTLRFNATGSGGHDLFYDRSTNEFKFKQAGGSVRLIIDATGHLMPGTDSQYNIGSSSVRFANIYADTLYGDGSNLTGINTDLVSDTSPQLGGDLDTNGNHILMDDSRIVKFGNDADMQLYHTGNHGYINNGTGNLYIRGGSDDIHIQAVSGEEGIVVMPNGKVKLYNDNVLTAQTEVWGLRVFAQGYDAIVQVQAEENRSAEVRIISDEGDDNGDYSRITKNKDTNALQIQDYGAGSWQNNIVCVNTGGVELYHSGTKRFETTSTGASLVGSLNTNGHVVPYSNNSWDLGSTSLRWRNVYTNDLHLSNEGHSNDVDGSWGDWTIQEGESDLFLKNNRSGKKYKFNLTEVS